MEFTVTLGQYVNGNGYLHRMDPRTKIICLILMIVSIFLIPNIYMMLGMLGLVLILIFAGKLNLLHIIKGLQPIIFIALFTFILQTIYTKDGKLLYTFNLNITLANILLGVLLLLVMIFTSKFIPRLKLFYYLTFFLLIFLVFAFNSYFPLVKWTVVSYKIYQMGLLNGGFYLLRIVLVLMISTIVTMTTSTMDINLGLEWLLAPLKLIKIPVSEIAMMLSLTLRFIPTLLLETEKIMNAQASRGVDFQEGSLMKRIKHIITLIIPMFVVSFNKAEDLANAMEVRGYVVGAKRTSIDELRFRLIDYLTFAFVLLIFAGVIVGKVML